MGRKIPFPQANCLDCAPRILEAAGWAPKGASTKEIAAAVGMDPRQGGYYANLGDWIKILAPSPVAPGFYVPTRAGWRILAAPPPDRLHLVKVMAVSDSILGGAAELMVRGGLDASAAAGLISKAVAEGRCRSVFGATMTRRIGCLRSLAWSLRDLAILSAHERLETLIKFECLVGA